MEFNFLKLADVENTAHRRWRYFRVIQWLMLAGVFLTPLFFLPWTTSILELNKQIFLAAVAGAGLILWLLNLVSTGRIDWRVNPVDRGVLAILGASVLASIFSLYKYKSVFGLPNSLSEALISIVGFSVIYFLVVNSFEDSGKIIRNVLVTSAALALLYGLFQVFGLYLFKSAYSSRVFNTVGSLNTLAVFGAVMLPLMIRSGAGRDWLKYLNILGALLALAVLVIMNWWILWLVTVAGMVSLIALESIHQPVFRMTSFIWPLTIIVLAVLMMVSNFNLASVRSKLPLEVAPSFKLSASVARGAIKENFLTGYGLENFSMAFDRYGASRLANTSLSDAKFFDGTGQIFNWAADGGLVMLLALGLLLWSLWRGVKRYAAWRREQPWEIISQEVWAGLTALLTALVVYPFNFVLMFLLYIFLALSVLSLWGTESRTYTIEAKPSLSLASSLGFVGGLIMVLVGLYFLASIYAADAYYARALGSKTFEEASRKMSRTINWNGQYDLYYRSASQTVLALLAGELNKKQDPKDNQRQARIQSYIISAVNLARQATVLNNRESLNWDNLGNVYQNLTGLVDGLDKTAEAAYLKEAEVRPGDTTVYNKIGVFYLGRADATRQLALAGQQGASAGQNSQTAELNRTALGLYGQAEAYFKKAIETSSNFGLAIYNLGIVYDRQGKLKESISQLERVIPFNADNPDLVFELGLLYYRDGQKEKAAAAMQRAVVLAPNYANAHWYLGLLYEEKKNYPSAISEMEKILAVEANKDNPAVLAKLDALKKGISSIPPEKVTDQKPL